MSIVNYKVPSHILPPLFPNMKWNLETFFFADEKRTLHYVHLKVYGAVQSNWGRQRKVKNG